MSAPTDVEVTSDAAGSLGFGAYFNAEWFSGAWAPSQADQSIAYKERFPVVVALHVWGSQWFWRHVLFRSDNEAVIHILHSRTSKVPCIMHLLRLLLSAAARFNFTFTSQHIPGIHNNIADALSRFHWQDFRFGSLGPALPCSSSSSALGALDPSSLEAQCHSFLVQGLAPSTHSSYRSGQKKFFEFCTQLGKIYQSGSPCPADEWTLCLFATFLASSVQHSTIKVYLSAVRALHIEQGFSDPLVDCPRLQRVLRGIQRTQGESSFSRLPVTDDIMMVIFRALDITHPDHCMF